MSLRRQVLLVSAKLSRLWSILRRDRLVPRRCRESTGFLTFLEESTEVESCLMMYAACRVVSCAVPANELDVVPEFLATHVLPVDQLVLDRREIHRLLDDLVIPMDKRSVGIYPIFLTDLHSLRRHCIIIWDRLAEEFACRMRDLSERLTVRTGKTRRMTLLTSLCRVMLIAI